jgi:hypothetical protein
MQAKVCINADLGSHMTVLARLMTFLCCGPLFFIAGMSSSSAMQMMDRIEFTPDSVTLMPGQTKPVSVELSDPIICPNGVVCDLKVNLESLQEDPRISISVSELAWAPTEWNQARTFEISMTGSASPLRVYSLSGSVASASELYAGFSPKFTVVAGRAAVPSLSAWAVFMLAIMLTWLVAYRFSRGN